MSRLALAARTFLAAIKKSPTAATGREAEDFERVLSSPNAGWDGQHTALNAPMAIYSWQTRDVLDVDTDETEGSELDIGEKVDIPGVLITLISIDEDPQKPVPPLEAFDVRIALAKKEVFTAKIDTKQAGTREQFCNAPGLSILVPRMWGLRVDNANRPTMSFQYRWALDKPIRASRNFAKTQITTILFVNTVDGDGRERN